MTSERVPAPRAGSMRQASNVDLATALAEVWRSFQAVHDGLPDATFETPATGRRVISCSADWTARPVKLVLDTHTQQLRTLGLLDWIAHAAAHGLSGGPSAGSSGRWHSNEFKSAAEHIGLVVEHAGESAGTGWSKTSLPPSLYLASALDVLSLAHR
jgi:hypothetical protein